MRKSSLFKYLLVSAAVLLLSNCTTSNKEEAADFIFTGGKIYTVNPEQPWAEAVSSFSVTAPAA